jgi:thymidylate synthase ThyX
MQKKITPPSAESKDKKEEIVNLSHETRELSWGGEVVVLNTGAIITAEDTAMLQALHSRDPKGIKSHLEKLAKTGSGNLMSSFYVGYGHKSIGDCASANIFAEGISMLAAKAVQDSQLYNGQECSTRYIDFATQPFLDGVKLSTEKNTETNNIHEKLREFYVESFPAVIDHLKKQYPKQENEDDKMYEKAIKARCFDILRGFLPAGAMTNVAWTGTLRNVADRLMYLRNHPLAEVREIAEKVEEAVSAANPNSFGHKRYEGTENYNHAFMKDNYYADTNGVTDEVRLEYDGIDRSELAKFKITLESRSEKTELPKQIGICGNSRISFLLDFGSWRDIQRHRSVIQLMPKLTVDNGFESWYIDNLPEDLKMSAHTLLSDVENSLKDIPENEKQYFIPMGYKVPVILSGDLSALTYITEIRATSFVHETLQKKAFEMADLLESTYGIKMHVNRQDFGRFNVKRGKQDIEER